MSRNDEIFANYVSSKFLYFPQDCASYSLICRSLCGFMHVGGHNYILLHTNSKPGITASYLWKIRLLGNLRIEYWAAVNDCWACQASGRVDLFQACTRAQTMSSETNLSPQGYLSSTRAYHVSLQVHQIGSSDPRSHTWHSCGFYPGVRRCLKMTKSNQIKRSWPPFNNTSFEQTSRSHVGLWEFVALTYELFGKEQLTCFETIQNRLKLAMSQNLLAGEWGK